MMHLSKAKDKLVSAVGLSTVLPMTDDPLADVRRAVQEYEFFLESVKGEIVELNAIFDRSKVHKEQFKGLTEVPLKCNHAVGDSDMEKIEKYVSAQAKQVTLVDADLKPRLSKLEQSIAAQTQLVSGATSAIQKRDKQFQKTTEAKGELEKAKATKKNVDKWETRHQECTEELGKCTSEVQGLCNSLLTSHGQYIAEAVATISSIVKDYYSCGHKEF